MSYTSVEKKILKQYYLKLNKSCKHFHMRSSKQLKMGC